MSDHISEKLESESPNQTGVRFGKGMAVAAHITGYIIGPLVIFAGLGWWLDQKFDTSPFIMLGAILLAFITTNILIFKRASDVVRSYAVPKEVLEKESATAKAMADTKPDQVSRIDTGNRTESE